MPQRGASRHGTGARIVILHRLYALLLVLALALAQSGSHLHALAHAMHEIASVEAGAKGAPPLDHAAEKCLFFQAIGSAISGAAPMARVAPEPIQSPRIEAANFAAASAVPFHSRAPPRIS